MFFIWETGLAFFVYRKMEGENEVVVRFMSDTPYARLEQEMQHIPGFRPRKRGMVIGHLSDEQKKQDCLCEHTSDGYISFHKLVEILTEEVAVSPFARRVNRLIGIKEPCFFRNGHRERFFMMLRRCIHKTKESALYAAIYLLSADRFLWGRALYAVTQAQIKFSQIHIHGVNLDGYVLFYMARDLYRGSQHVSLSELIDPELVSDQVFERIVIAFLICRYGSAILQEEGLQ